MEDITTLATETCTNQSAAVSNASKHGSFCCYNKNYLLAAVINASGLLVDENMRQDMIKKMTDMKHLCCIYLNKQFYKYEYHELAKEIGPIEDYWDIIRSDDFELIKLLRGNRTHAGNILKAINAYVYDETAPYRINSERMFELFHDKNIEEELKHMIDEKGGEDLSKLVRARKMHERVLNLLSEKLKFTKVVEFNARNRKYASMIINNYNSTVINTYSTEKITFSNDLDYLKILDDLLEKGKIDKDDKEYILSKCLDINKLNDLDFALDYKNQLKAFVNQEKITPIIDKCIKDFDAVLRLYDQYTYWHMYDEIEPIDIYTPITPDMTLTYNNQTITMNQIITIANQINYNSPAIKSRFIYLINKHHREMRIKATYYFVKAVRSGDPKYRSLEYYKQWISDPKNVAYDPETENYDFVHAWIDSNDYNPITYATKGIAYSRPHIDKVLINDDDIFDEEGEYLKTYFCYYTAASLQKQLSGYLQGQLEKDLHYIYKQYKDLSYDTDKPSPEWEGWRLYKPQWKVCGVTTKRWSAGIHTWKPGTDVFRLLVPEKDHVALYFDISQAEVRFAAFTSGDPTLLKMYEDGIDMYIRMSELAFPNDHDPQNHRDNRKIFKTVVLGLLYGRGAYSISTALSIEMSEALRLIKIFRDLFPVLNAFIERKKKYCAEHNGRIETFLGDRLSAFPERAMTCGINYFIQNAASVCLGEGFENIYENNYRDGRYISPKIVVHDSHTMTVHISQLFEVIDSITKYFKEYEFEKYGVLFKYDLITMANFRDKLDFSWDKENNSIKLSGNRLGFDSWMAMFDKYYTYDLEITKDEDDHNFLVDSFFTGLPKNYKFCPENNWIIPGSKAGVVKNIHKKDIIIP